MKLTINRLEGYAGLRLKNNQPLIFEPGINLLVGRNGAGKSNLIRLVRLITENVGDLSGKIESSLFQRYAKAALGQPGASIHQRFGEVEIATHSFRGVPGRVYFTLKKLDQERYLENIMRQGNGFAGYLDIQCETSPGKFRIVSGSSSAPKLEMTGHPFDGSLFSKEHDNKAHQMMESAIQSVNAAIRKQVLVFFESEVFSAQIEALEEQVNHIFARFLGHTEKQLKIDRGHIRSFGSVSLMLMDRGNHITSESISTGESVLLNLTFALASAKQDPVDVLCFDEPELHMHDDMIGVLVEELSHLTRLQKDLIIVLATHSTSVVEKVAALRDDPVNIVSIDNNKIVGSSKNDVDLINALQRNGVSFSPLMLTRRATIYIENRHETGREHAQFLSKFFPADSQPNIVPIGHSGNVDESHSFSAILQDILRVSDISSVGVQDGDGWFKSYMSRYLKSEIELPTLVDNLRAEQAAIVKATNGGRQRFFFNCWEIENLYLLDDCIHCWQWKNNTSLTREQYIDLLADHRQLIADEYFKTFHKMVIRIRISQPESIHGAQTSFANQVESIRNVLHDNRLKHRMEALVDAILKEELIHWVPGKEIRKLLLAKGYRFQGTQFNFIDSTFGQLFRSAINELIALRR